MPEVEIQLICLVIHSRSGDPNVWCRRQQNCLVQVSFNMTLWGIDRTEKRVTSIDHGDSNELPSTSLYFPQSQSGTF
jgi:hypothetical protein